MASRLEVVKVDEIEEAPVTQRPAPAPVPEPRREERVAVEATELLGLMLKVLSQRSIALLGHLIPLLALVGMFVLGQSIIADPSWKQIGVLLVLGAFGLAYPVIRR